MRFRNVFMILGSILVLALWMIADPKAGLIQNLPFGASTIATLVILLKSVVYVGVLHMSRKALLDYFDLEAAITKAMSSSEGAGNVVIGVGIIYVAIAITIFAAVSN